MFEKGEYIIYGKTGVCEVRDIGYPTMPGLDASRLYYTLTPMGSSEMILTPVDTKVFMRRVISRDEALRLIRHIPDIEEKTDIPSAFGSKELPGIYDTLFATHDCEDLIRLIIMIYTRSQRAMESKRKITQTDQNYMRGAEEVLYGELAVALGMERAAVPAFIAAEVGKVREEKRR